MKTRRRITMKKLALIIDSACKSFIQVKENKHTYVLKSGKASEVRSLVDTLLDTYEEVIVVTNDQAFHDANISLVNDFNGRCMVLNLNDNEELHEALYDLREASKDEKAMDRKSLIFHLMKRQESLRA